MTDKDLIPELHDILKLIHPNVLDHVFSEEQAKPYKSKEPNTLTWRGVKYHHRPVDRPTFFLHLADVQGSSFARLDQKIKDSHKAKKAPGDKPEHCPYVHKLWQPPKPGEVTSDYTLKTSEEIIALLEYLQKDPVFTEIYESKYGNLLIKVPEDKYPGLNITSLRSHMVIVGKLHRLLNDTSQYTLTDDEKTIIDNINIQSNSNIERTIRNLAQRWQLILARLQLDFPQSPFRARDFRIFDVRREAIDKIKKDFPDNILMTFDDQIIMMCDVRERIGQIALTTQEKGLLLQEVSCQLPFAELRGKNPDPAKLARARNIPPTNHYPVDLPLKIKPDLCEICQMARATKVWPDHYIQRDLEPEEELGREVLCERCFNLRQEPSRLKKFAQWGKEDNVLVAWLHHSLDFSKLLRALQNLHWQYLQQTMPEICWSGNGPKPGNVHGKITWDDAVVKFPLVEEFSQDYAVFVDALNQGLMRHVKEENFEALTDHLCCVRLEKRGQILDLLECYWEVLGDHFHALRDCRPSPLRLGAVLCRAKFPFFQVWRQINNAEREIEIALMGHGVVALDHGRLPTLFKARDGKYKKSALHALAEIAKTSEALARIKFQNRDDREDHPTYQHIHELVMKPLGMDFRSMLTFAQLLEDES